MSLDTDSNPTEVVIHVKQPTTCCWADQHVLRLFYKRQDSSSSPGHICIACDLRKTQVMTRHNIQHSPFHPYDAGVPLASAEIKTKSLPVLHTGAGLHDLQLCRNVSDTAINNLVQVHHGCLSNQLQNQEFTDWKRKEEVVQIM